MAPWQASAGRTDHEEQQPGLVCFKAAFTERCREASGPYPRPVFVFGTDPCPRMVELRLIAQNSWRQAAGQGA